MIVRLEPITASVVAVMGWARNTATAAALAPVTVVVETPQYVWAQ